MKRSQRRNSIAALIFTAVILVLSHEAKADYFPSKEFISYMTNLALKEPTNIYNTPDGLLIKTVSIGTSYQVNQVAYFFVAINPISENILDIGMQLEDWNLLENGDFQLTISRMLPDRMNRWSLTLKADGTLINGSITPEETFSVNSPEAIKASERVQEILKAAYKSI